MAIVLSLPFAGGLAAYPVYQRYGPVDMQRFPHSQEPSSQGFAHFHEGIDYTMGCGTPILAAGAGTVTWAGKESLTGSPEFGYGLYVMIQHTDGVDNVWTLYGHQSVVYVNVGDTVTQGQRISDSGGGTGDVSRDGNSSGCHLHFGVLNGGLVSEDPNLYLSGQAPVGGVAPATLTPAQAVYYARGAGLPQDQLVIAVAVGLAESGLRVGAVNTTSGASGVWQILPSAHPEYDVTRLRTDPAYNAGAMVSTYKAQGWSSGWETYSTGAFLQYLPTAQAAVAATPAGTVPSGLDGGQTVNFYSPYTPGLDTVPEDTTPQLAVLQIPVQQVTPRPDLIIPKPWPYQPTALIQVGDSAWLPCLDCSYTDRTWLKAGDFTVTLAYDDLVRRTGDTVQDQLYGRQFTQLSIKMGYVADLGHIDPATVPTVFTGVVNRVKPTHTGPQRNIAISGPDITGIFSDPSSTSSQLNSFVNLTPGEVVSRLVLAHNPKGRFGLTVNAASNRSKTGIGDLLGQANVKTRTQGQTEWDVMVQAAQSIGAIIYADGTMIVMGPLPAPGDPLILTYEKDGEPASAISGVTPGISPSAKRSYNVVAQSYQIKTKKNLAVSATGANTDATTTATIYAPINTSQQHLQSMADGALARFQATEIQLGLELVEPVPLRRGQPLVLRSDHLYKAFVGQLFYPTDVTRRYSATTGLTMSLTAGSLPYAVLANNTTVSNLGF